MATAPPLSLFGLFEDCRLSAIGVIKCEISDAIDCDSPVSSANLIQQYGSDLAPEQLLTVAFDLLQDQTARARVFMHTIDFTYLELSKWVTDWKLSEAAIADLNARLNDLED